MNNLKSKAGFTLVELIVVIAILAILAGVAVPAYTGYIAKAEQAADMQALAAVNTAVHSLAAGKGATVEAIEVTDAGAVTATLDPSTATIASADVATLTGELDYSDDFAGASWSSGTWTLN